MNSSDTSLRQEAILLAMFTVIYYQCQAEKAKKRLLTESNLSIGRNELKTGNIKPLAGPSGLKTDDDKNLRKKEADIDPEIQFQLKQAC